MLYIILRGHWCDIVLNVLIEDKTDDVKDRFYEDLEQYFNKFSKHHMKIVLEDFNAKIGKEDIVKPIIWNEGLHKISNDNGVIVVNFATYKNVVMKSTSSYAVTFINSLGHLPMERCTNKSTIFR
jgi:hypothetical protein